MTKIRNSGIDLLKIISMLLICISHAVQTSENYLDFDYYETFKRLTYKVGFKYGNTYLVKDGYHMKSGSFTLGVDIPLKRGSLSKVAVAIEGGMRGEHVEGQVKEMFLKINFGFQFFGDDMWFQKRKFY